MIKFAGKEVQEEWLKAFGTSVTTEQQMWVLVKLFKHARGRCRSNVAMNNWLKDCFPNFRFSQVEKTKENGEKYPGLEITKCD